jgi:hypothetical protein
VAVAEGGVSENRFQRRFVTAKARMQSLMHGGWGIIQGLLTHPLTGIFYVQIKHLLQHLSPI